jgi:hypothetical protein
LPCSQSGGSWSDSIQVSSVGHQSQYEMFGNWDIPFHGDYNRISLDDPDHPLFADMSWTDNRDVVTSTDPREIEEQEGFEVLQCHVDLAEDTQSKDDGPRPTHLIPVTTAAASTRTSTAAPCSSRSVRLSTKTGASGGSRASVRFGGRHGHRLPLLKNHTATPEPIFRGGRSVPVEDPARRTGVREVF